jgi:cytochrome c oxidase subunit 3/cytochrome o ubiquinol oxidase subunit 3
MNNKEGAAMRTTENLTRSSGHGHEAIAILQSPPKVGMLCFLVTEAAFFSTLVVTYLILLEKSRPVAAAVLSLPLVIISSICLLSSSATVHLATGALQRGSRQAFLGWWALTIGLGMLFLVGTGVEWAELIGTHGLTMGTNLFGTTYFTLVGFHAAHVTVGILLMLAVLVLTMQRQLSRRQQYLSAELTAWYWHFVDGVWVVVFTVVYLLGR